MELLKVIKIGVVVVIILIVLIRLIAKLRNRKNPFLNLNVADNHQDYLAPNDNRPKVLELLSQYADSSDTKDAHLSHSLSELLLDPLPKLIQQPNEVEYYKRLNKPQRIFSLAMQFEGQVDNGGVYQFLWNRPFSMYAMKEALIQLNIEPLATDYTTVLNELEKNAEHFSKDKQFWNDPGNDDTIKWQRFQEGRKYIPTGTKIEAYFYNDDFKTRWNTTLADYVKQNLNRFIAE